MLFTFQIEDIRRVLKNMFQIEDHIPSRNPGGSPNWFQIDGIGLQPHKFDRSQMHEKQFSNRRY